MQNENGYTRTRIFLGLSPSCGTERICSSMAGDTHGCPSPPQGRMYRVLQFFSMLDKKMVISEIALLKALNTDHLTVRVHGGLAWTQRAYYSVYFTSVG